MYRHELTTAQSDVIYVSILGRGTFGDVWKCKLNGEDSPFYACKVIRKPRKGDDSALVQNELAIWKKSLRG